jgi:hypothetical protein
LPLYKRHRVIEPVLECLGLHNKPKAEVHPGHKLTGPKEEEEEEEEEEPSTHLIGSWVDPRGSVDGCGKSRPHWSAISILSSP